MDVKKITPIAILMIVVGFIIGYVVKTNVVVTKQGATIIDSTIKTSKSDSVQDQNTVSFNKNLSAFLEKTGGNFDKNEWAVFLEQNGARLSSDKAFAAQKALNNILVSELIGDFVEPSNLPDGGGVWNCVSYYYRNGVYSYLVSFESISNHTGLNDIGNGWSSDTYCQKIYSDGWDPWA